MPDIIVTTPKNRMAKAAREAEELKAAGGGYYYRDYRSSHVPDVDVGDRVYYVEDRYIRGFCLVSDVVQVSISTLRILMDATTWKWIKPIPASFSPRSWCYAITMGRAFVILREDVEVLGGWLEPKPEVKEPCRP